MCNFHFRRHIRQHGRFKELTALGVPLAARHHARTFCQRIGDMFFHFQHGIFVDQRPLHHSSFHTIANGHRRHFRRQLGRKLIIDGILHKNAIRTHAGLPGVAEFGGHGALHRRINIRVVKHNKRRVAAKLQRHFLDGAGALRHQLLTDFCRAGKGKFAYQRMGGQFFTYRACRTGDHRNHALGDARTLRQFTQRQR